MPPEAVAFLMLFGLIGGVVLLFPVARALADRLRSGADPRLKDDFRRLREEMLEELQQVHREVGELTERVDFAERLLAKQRDPQRLASGKD